MENTDTSSQDWLREVAAVALAWEAAAPDPTSWRSWIYAPWHPDILTDVDGFDSTSYQSTRDGTSARIGRLEPSASSIQAALSGVRLPDVARAVVVLVRSRLVVDGLVPHPTMLPAGRNWPDKDPSLNSPLPRSGQFPAVTAFAMDRSGALAILARPADPDQARASGLFPPGADVENSLIPFTLEQGFTLLDRSEAPYPWMRHCLTGSSGLDLDSLPADPSLTMLSRWLGNLCDTIDLDEPEGGGPSWYDALGKIDFYSAYRSWEQVRADQAGDRLLGEWVSRERVGDIDLPLFAISFLSAMPAPPVMLSTLRRRLPDARIEEVVESLQRHPELSRWLG